VNTVTVRPKATTARHRVDGGGGCRDDSLLFQWFTPCNDRVPRRSPDVSIIWTQTSPHHAVRSGHRAVRLLSFHKSWSLNLFSNFDWRYDGPPKLDRGGK
jgi:hypothetical protein